MFSPFSRPTGRIFYRACVALREILAARKRPPPRGVRKAAGIMAACLAMLGHVRASEDLPAPPSGPPGAHAITVVDDRIRPIESLRSSITPPAGELPSDFAQAHFAGEPRISAAAVGGRGWLNYAYFWQASALCHRPLYFEEPNLERYGHQARFGLQPALSGAHFFAASAALPARMVIDRPWRCVYTLGHARPGSDATWARHR